MAQSKHTSTPWKFKHYEGRLSRIWRNDPDNTEDTNRGYALIARHVTPEDAAFIVRAANNHEALIVCLEAAIAREHQMILRQEWEKVLAAAKGDA